jgi:hypothetical protein
MYDNGDIMRHYVNNLARTANNIYNIYEVKKAKMILTEEDEIAYHYARHCHLCQGELGKLPVGYKIPKVAPKVQPDTKVRDHCHITGKFSGSTHSIYNLNYRVPKFYPVIMHNLTKLHTISDEISSIPHTDEKYITFSCKVKVGEYKDKDGNVQPIKRE